MESLVQRLKDVEAQKYGDLHEITILAARSALAVAEKYQLLAGECEIYEISMGTPNAYVRSYPVT